MNTIHEKGSDAKILLTGVFGPFAQDDEYGSRKVNPMELYHNQVTRLQGPFSLRMFHRTFGLLMIEANIDAPCTILEFAPLDRFIDEIKNNSYDIIGINGIQPNILKVQKMCEEIRKHSPETSIVIGGHIASKDDLDQFIDADHVCKGDGIKWFRKFLGEDVDAPIKHPALKSGFGTRIMGTSIPSNNTAGVLIPSVGCPMGCNFCSTSALFGGKGKSVSFFETGDELYNVLVQLEDKLKVTSFFVLDENFLLYKNRALRLLKLMEENNKSWEFYVFSSARVIESYTMEQLISLGISWVWMGLEGENSQYNKLDGVDTIELVKKLQYNGIRVLGSTIIGMEEHSPENIDEAINFAVKHDTDFHQFMLYTPLSGTPLYEEHKAKGNLLSEEECPVHDVHGQERFNFIHKNIPKGSETQYLLNAFQRDFDINGPSICRISRTNLLGWKKHIKHSDKRIAKRFKGTTRGIGSVYSGSLWAMAHYYKNDDHLYNRMKKILHDMYRSLGLITRIISPVVGRFILFQIKKEEKRLNEGWTYEPTMIYEKNLKALELEQKDAIKAVGVIEKPAYDLSLVKERCFDLMTDIRNQVTEKKEYGQEQLSSLYDQLMEKTDQYQVKEKLSEKIDVAAKQMRSIRANMLEKYESAQMQMDEIHQTMTSKYSASKKQIDEIHQAFEKKCAESRKSFESTYEMLERKLQLM